MSQYIQLLLLVLLLPWTNAYQQYCKCQCSAEDLIVPIKACALCTKDVCLASSKDFCKDEEIKLSCYQVESVKDQMVVYGFIGLVGGLVMYAVYRRSVRRR